MNKRSFETFCVKESKDPRTTKPHNLPIYSTASFEFENIDQGIGVFDGSIKGHLYARYGNPTVEPVAAKIAAMEGYGLEIEPFGVMTSSGMAAISTLIFGLFNKGEAILTQGNIYGGTTTLIKDVFSKFGIESYFTNLKDQAAIQKSLSDHPNIRAIYFETPSNPGLDCIDMTEIAGIAKSHGIFTIIDNTFCSPAIQQPFAFGIDFIVHSTTKYLNGHGNSISGIVLGREQRYFKPILDAMKYTGMNLSPWEAWLVNNGLKTLPLRMEKHSTNALALAQMLENHNSVKKVNYAGLESHPDHELATRQMNGYGGMLSFEVKGGVEAGKKLMNHITMGTLAPTLGDIDTLLMHPASMSHRGVPREMRLTNGITDGLIRVSVGIESSDDLLSDFDNALSRL